MRAFLLYIDDWLSSPRISLMDAHEERGYFRLILHEYLQPDCGLPDDDKVLAVWSKLGPQWWLETRDKSLRQKGVTSGAKLRACFELRNGRLFNERLYREWLHQQEVRQTRSESGRRGAAKRWKQLPSFSDGNCHSEKIAKASVSQWQTDANDVWACVYGSDLQASENNQDPQRARARPEGYDPRPGWAWFSGDGGNTVAPYPHIRDMDAAARAWVSVVDSQAVEDEIRRALAPDGPWRRSEQWSRGIFDDAANWLLRKLWRGRPAPIRVQEDEEVQRLKALARKMERGGAA
jgi:uncharacterized protein YdaU (DUF1376 family)